MDKSKIKILLLQYNLTQIKVLIAYILGLDHKTIATEVLNGKHPTESIRIMGEITRMFKLDSTKRGKERLIQFSPIKEVLLEMLGGDFRNIDKGWPPKDLDLSPTPETPPSSIQNTRIHPPEDQPFKKVNNPDKNLKIVNRLLLMGLIVAMALLFWQPIKGVYHQLLLTYTPTPTPEPTSTMTPTPDLTKVYFSTLVQFLTTSPTPTHEFKPTATPTPPHLSSEDVPPAGGHINWSNIGAIILLGLIFLAGALFFVYASKHRSG